MDVMEKIGNRWAKPGFSLIELLVVTAVLAILMAIVVPSLINSQPSRNLASASERFGLDVKFAMQTAQATGNDVIIGFDYDLNPDNIEDAIADDGSIISIIQPGGRFVNPGNPGVARVAKRYFIVEARKRWRDEVLVGTLGGPNYKRSDEPRHLIPFTYLDWLNLYDAYDNGTIANPPVEPLFPYAAGPGTPKDGDFNALAEPRYVYPMNIRAGGNDYLSRFLGGTPDWTAGDIDDQVYKLFCVADQAEILAYDQNPIRLDDKGRRIAGPEDSPYLGEQIIDYVLLKEVELPEHVVFMNPTKNYWVTDYEDNGGGTEPIWQDMQFLQHLWVFHPSGEVALANWSYDSNGDPDVYYHGQIAESNDTPQAHCFWLTLEEVAEDVFDGDTLGGSPFDERKAQQAMNGRMFVLWPLNGQYEVLDYAPNDIGKGSLEDRINNGDPLPTTDAVLAKREIGYNQNFLTGQ
jgi:prepilin-type N-terminal cleavage/methylation domain-containing protein